MTSGFDARLRETVAIRGLESKDRGQIEELVRAAANFTAEEKRTALEVVDDALGGDPDYIVNVLQNDQGKLLGYECHGHTPLTDGTFDLYWIVVTHQAQKRGYGRRLLRAAEDDARRRGGRLLLIETSSLPSYRDTVRFYERNGYRVEARICDFYRLGDDKLVLARNLGAAL